MQTSHLTSAIGHGIGFFLTIHDEHLDNCRDFALQMVMMLRLMTLVVVVVLLVYGARFSYLMTPALYLGI